MNLKYEVAIAALALAVSGWGCASAHTSAGGAGGAVATTHTSGGLVRTGSGAQLAAAVKAEDDDMDDTPRGVLVIGGDIVSSCANVRALRPRTDDTMAWLAILRSVAACMKEGELRARNIVLQGPSRPQVIVKYIFSRFGVTEDRVEMTTTPDSPACADDCDPSDMRVDIGLSKSAPSIVKTL
jgi:hypothetical protein